MFVITFWLSKIIGGIIVLVVFNKNSVRITVILKFFILIKISFISLIFTCAYANTEDDTIIIATHIEPPLVYIKDGVFAGPNVEVAKVLMDAAGKKATFIYCPFARCLTMTKDGKADMMIAINKTMEREKYLDYLAQPFSSKITPVRFYVKQGSILKIDNYEDLQGLNIGVLRGATYFPRFDNDNQLNKVDITTHKQLIEMLLKNRIDTFLGRELSIKSRVDEDVYNTELVVTPYIYNKTNDSYIVVSKKSAAKIDVKQLSKILDSLLADGTIDKLIDLTPG